ncbi:DUF4240 domain-containing protein [Micromonospora lupini]|uniref:DUF4240 domain-containing protein n=1 Tax=Micromonospora lupini str. Lupac 08 TaxID=1150864 RepID=I0KV91_9ACTN|nr:DUF4240 domain-containing protein [Micromonospora lupini]CCH15488.1 Conserved hypothetical protein [Micromonospora lupini str. Lupac 08]
MDVEEFWSVVERARAAAGVAADQPRRDGQPSVVAEALVAELMRLPLSQIVAFDQVLDEVADHADTWDVCAACWIIEYGFLSDDGFSDFQAGLVGLGRAAFESAARDPDSLADHPAVRQISAAEGRDLWIGDEALQFAAQTAYERLTGDDEAFWDAAEAAQSAVTTPPHPGPEPADERWDLSDEDEWRRRLPRLFERFRARRLAVQ